MSTLRLLKLLACTAYFVLAAMVAVKMQTFINCVINYCDYKMRLGAGVHVYMASD